MNIETREQRQVRASVPSSKRRVTRSLWILTLGLILVMAFGVARGTAYAAAGDLDTSFGGDGTVATDFQATSDDARAVAIQPNGKIVAVGTTYIRAADYNFAVTRYNPDGSPDTTFDLDGKVVSDFDGGDDGANALAIQPNGKIVVAGYCTFQGNGRRQPGVARYNPDGSLDNTFSDDGWLCVNVYSGVFNGVAIQPDGKIMLAGAFNDTFSLNFYLVRLTAAGTFDTTFDADGVLSTDFFVHNDEARALAIQPDGKIVVAGNAQVNGFNYDFALARYLPNGALDQSFSGDGKVTTDYFGGDDGAYAIALHPDGYIYAAGAFFSAAQSYDFGIARYLPNGNLDTNFTSDGLVGITFAAGNAGEVAYALAIQPSDGKVVVGGYAPVGAFNDFALARLLYDGSLDPTFGGDGKVTTEWEGGPDVIHGLAVQADGKIVAAGWVYTYLQNNYDFGVARYKSADPPTAPPTATRTSTRTPTRTPIGLPATPTPGAFTVTGAIDTDDPAQLRGVITNDPPSTCAQPQPCAFSAAKFYNYDAYTFTNSGGATCVTVTLQTTCTDLHAINAVAYLNSFDPTRVCTSYLGDIGLSPGPNAPKRFSFSVPAGATYIVVVSELMSSQGCSSYTLTVTP